MEEAAAAATTAAAAAATTAATTTTTATNETHATKHRPNPPRQPLHGRATDCFIVLPV